MADLSLSQWPKFISVEVSNAMRISDLFQSQCREWDPVVVIHALREVLGECVMSIALSHYRSQDIRVWPRSSCIPRVVMSDLYQMYQEEPYRSLDVGWI